MPQVDGNTFENNSISSVYGNSFVSNTTADTSRLTVGYPTTGITGLALTTAPPPKANWDVVAPAAPVEEGPLAWLRRRISEVTENVPW